MPWVILIIGLVLIRAGYKGQTDQLQALLVRDFTGTNSFLYWVAALAVIGGIGYAPGFEKPSRAMMLLVILVMILSNHGVFAQFQSAIANYQPGPQTNEANNGAALPDQTGQAPSANANAPDPGAQAAAQAGQQILQGNGSGAAGTILQYFLQGPADWLGGLF